MQVTIIPSDKAVYVDGRAIEIQNFDDLGVAPNIDAVVWDSTTKRGEVHYKRPAPTVLDEVMFNAMYIQAVAHHENRDMDLKLAEEQRRLKDEAHTKKLQDMVDERLKQEAATQEKIAALEAQVAKLTAGA